jgi:hypothetical protein
MPISRDARAGIRSPCSEVYTETMRLFPKAPRAISPNDPGGLRAIRDVSRPLLAASTAFTTDEVPGTGRPAKRKILYRFALRVEKSAQSKAPAKMAKAPMMAMSTSVSFIGCLLR